MNTVGPSIVAQAASKGPALHAKPRHLGLDLVRATAITLVVISHANMCFPSIWPLSIGVTDYLGYVGVELFFSLSGFLIGGVLLDIDAGTAGDWWLGRFWSRRWLRTLPAYYAYLTFAAVSAGQIDWPSILFVQRFFPGSENFFGVSWSLAMEEWFYLLLPLIVLLVGRLSRRPPTTARVLCRTAIAIIVTCLAARAIFIHFRVLTPWLGELSFRSHPIVRLDCCAYGVLLAGLVRLDPARAKAVLLRHSPVVTFGLCLAPVVALGIIFNILVRFDPALERRILFRHWGDFYFIFGHAIVDVAAAIFVSMIYFIRLRVPTLMHWTIAGLSRISYSVYLFHVPFNAFFAREILPNLNLAEGVVLYVIFLLIGSAISYRLIEWPFLWLRDAGARAPRPDAKPRHSEGGAA